MLFGHWSTYFRKENPLVESGTSYEVKDTFKEYSLGVCTGDLKLQLTELLCISMKPEILLTTIEWQQQNKRLQVKIVGTELACQN